MNQHQKSWKPRGLITSTTKVGRWGGQERREINVSHRPGLVRGTGVESGVFRSSVLPGETHVTAAFLATRGPSSTSRGSTRPAARSQNSLVWSELIPSNQSRPRPASGHSALRSPAQPQARRECRAVQALRERVWWLFKKAEVESWCDPTAPLPGPTQRAPKGLVHTETCTQTSIALLRYCIICNYIIVAQSRNNPNVHNRRIKKMWCIHTVECSKGRKPWPVPQCGWALRTAHEGKKPDSRVAHGVTVFIGSVWTGKSIGST